MRRKTQDSDHHENVTGGDVLLDIVIMSAVQREMSEVYVVHVSATPRHYALCIVSVRYRRVRLTFTQIIIY